MRGVNMFSLIKFEIVDNKLKNCVVKSGEKEALVKERDELNNKHSEEDILYIVEEETPTQMNYVPLMEK